MGVGWCRCRDCDVAGCARCHVRSAGQDLSVQADRHMGHVRLPFHWSARCNNHAARSAAKTLGSSMPRALWKGAVSFGLIYVPVELRTASRENTLPLHMLDSRDFA